MNSQNLYKLLTRRKNLTRDNLRSENLDSTNRGEWDAFDQEAIEGWNQEGYADQKMRTLDKRFNSGNSNFYRTAFLLLLLAIIPLSIFLYQGQSETAIAKIDNPTNVQLVESTDLFVSKRYDTLVEETSVTKKAIRQLKKSQEARPFLPAETKPELPKHEVGTLPFKSAKVDSDKSTPLNLRRKMKEVNLSEFILIDYRTIRKSPTIATQQMDLMGTSANLEGKNSSSDEIVWKKIDVPYIEYLEKTMELVAKGNIKKALDRMDVILQTYPDDINALFYSAFCTYQLGDNKGALISFQRVLSHPYSNFDEDAQWYIAKCYLQANEKSKAKEWFNAIAQGNGFYAEQASKLLQQMK